MKNDPIHVPPGWLLYKEQLINTNFLYLVEPNGKGVHLQYMTGKTIGVPVSMGTISFMLNEALLSAALDKPEQAMLLALKAEKTVLQQKVARLEADLQKLSDPK